MRYNGNDTPDEQTRQEEAGSPSMLLQLLRTGGDPLVGVFKFVKPKVLALVASTCKLIHASSLLTHAWKEHIPPSWHKGGIRLLKRQGYLTWRSLCVSALKAGNTCETVEDAIIRSRNLLGQSLVAEADFVLSDAVHRFAPSVRSAHITLADSPSHIDVLPFPPLPILPPLPNYVSIPLMTGQGELASHFAVASDCARLQAGS
eukprot:1975408-Rhodomonas_salina.2